MAAMAEDEISPEVPFMGSSYKDNSSADDLSPADLLELRTKLEEELKILELARASEEIEGSSPDTTELQLQAKVSELKEKFLEESNKISLQEVIIKRLEMHELLCSVLFKDTKDARDSKITADCIEESKIASEIMRIQKEVDELQKTHDEMKLDNLKLKQSNSELMEKLKRQRKNAQSQSLHLKIAKNKDYKALKSELDVRNKSLNLLQHIIPCIAIGTGNIDSHLQALILECGEENV